MEYITTRAFGLTIGFLLPGLAGLFALSNWIPKLQEIFQALINKPWNLGLFFLIMLGSLIIGLQISIIRWLLFEQWWLKSQKIESAEFSGMSDENRLIAFRASVDEHYRYHQFYGGIFVVIPILFIGWWQHPLPNLTDTSKAFFVVLFLCILIITFYAAKDAYIKTIERGKSILSGG